MTRLRILLSKIAGLFRKAQLEQQLDEDVRAHLEMLAEENLRKGMTAAEAHYAALRQFGNVGSMKEECRETWSIRIIEELVQDVRYGLRRLRRNPGFTAVAVLTLALGIGGATALFSVVYCGVLNPFPFRDSHRLVAFVAHDSRVGQGEGFGELYSGITPPEFLDYRDQNHVFDEVIGAAWDKAILTGTGPARLYRARPVTDDYFRVLGVTALFGRTLTPADSRPGAPPVAVVGYKAWQKDFGADPGIVGRTIVLNHRSTTVVGVMPPRFTLQQGDVYLPTRLTPNKQGFFSFFAHLKPGVTIDQANAEIGVLAKRFAAKYGYPPEVHFGVVSLAHGAIGAISETWYVLLGAVVLLLLIACVNVANLLLARATVREREISVRAALGASRGRLVRQLLIESLILAAGGAALGCLFAWDVLKGLVAIIPAHYLPSEAVIRINPPVLLFTLSTAVFCTLLFGLAPAILATGTNLQDPLRASGRGGGETRGRTRSRNLLVVGEVALSLVLLCNAALLLRSMFALRHADLGFDPSHLLVGTAELPDWTTAQICQFQLDLLRRVQPLPGVRSAALDYEALRGGGPRVRIEIEGKSSPENWSASWHGASDRFFETAGIPVLQGRDFSEEEFEKRRKVAIINRAFAHKYFAGENPLGHVVKFPEDASAGKDPGFEIIGVVADVRDDGPDKPPEPYIYCPYGTWGKITLLVRTVGAPASVTGALRRAVMSINKDVPMEAKPLRNYLVENYYTEPRFVVEILVAFAVLGTLLVSVGVYSVLSYAVSRQTHEIGVRMALGAQVAEVRGMVLKWGLRWLAIGIGIGIPASIALEKALRNRIWGIKSADPLTMVAVSLVLTAVGLAACYFPARRASKVDPMVALRYE